MTVVEAINALTDSLSRPSLADWLMVAATIVYVAITTYILLYNINLVKVTRNVQKQNIDLQLFEKRYEITNSINEYFECQIQNIKISMISLKDEFKITNLPQQDIDNFRASAQKCNILFNEEYIERLSAQEKQTNKCFKLLNEIKNTLSEYCFIYHKGGEYNDMIVKMRRYFDDYYKKNIDLDSLKKCLASINSDEVFELLSELETEYEKLSKEYSENSIEKLFSKNNLSFLE